MTKEEIALQLSLKSLDTIKLAPSSNDDINTYIGEEVAKRYNTIYNNLDCFNNTDSKLLDTISDIPVI